MRSICLNFDSLNIYSSVIIVSCKVSGTAISIFDFTVIDIVPVCITISIQVFSTIDLIPAITSGTIFYYIVVSHVVGCCINTLIKVTIQFCIRTNFYSCIINPLIQHLTMIVEHVVFTIDFLLACIMICFTGRLEPVPTFIVAVVIFRTIKNYFQIIIIIQIVLIVTGFLKPQPLRLSSPTSSSVPK